jgi:VanZ family protein
MLKLITWFKPIAGYLLVATAIFILVFSSIPSIPVLKIHTAKSDIRLDYAIHFLEYGFLASLAYLTFTGSDFKMPVKKYLLVTFLVVCFALFDEFHQKLIPGRTFNVKDIISNLTGIVASLAFCILVFGKIIFNKAKHNKDC